VLKSLVNSAILEISKSYKTDMENKGFLFLRMMMLNSLLIILSAFTSIGKVTREDLPVRINGADNQEGMTSDAENEDLKLPLPLPSQVDEIVRIVNDRSDEIEDIGIKDAKSVKGTKSELLPIQTKKGEKEKDEDGVFVVVENMPEFPGGEFALRKFLTRSIKYPNVAEENGIQGKVYVNFVVDKDGSVSNAKIARGVDPSIDKEALRVVMTLPKWKPGIQRGKAVRVSYTVSISFQLQ